LRNCCRPRYPTPTLGEDAEDGPIAARNRPPPVGAQPAQLLDGIPPQLTPREPETVASILVRPLTRRFEGGIPAPAIAAPEGDGSVPVLLLCPKTLQFSDAGQPSIQPRNGHTHPPCGAAQTGTAHH